MQDITIGVSSGAGGGIVGVLLTLGFIWAKAKLNGKTSAPQEGRACPATAAKLDALSNDHARQDGILGKLADARVEHSTLMKQQLKATETQNEILRDRLPRSGP